ncbi:MAG: hypothetical protein A2X94_03520 [Bdellovibrionales bacterium GWB1_55_8]|nr:MAG: hypothetical protein A2X94_03520 [Bdellovibrionales bacterium GWB1_55_8]
MTQLILARLPKFDLLSESFGALAAMLVALPAAIAFGLLVYAPLGPAHAGAGALAGILGAVALGLIAPALGGTPRLISAPCAPAAAVLAAFAAELVRSQTISAEHVVSLISLVAVGAGGLQLIFGALGGGRLIKYIPYPVVAGYLSGVGVLILLGQLPKLFALPKGTALSSGLFNPELWSGPALGVGLVTVAAMLLAPKLTRVVPATIIALASGVAAYFAIAFFVPELRVLAGNALVIGPIGLPSGADVQGSSSSLSRLLAFTDLSFAELNRILVPMVTLGVLLSIDTLKTCVVVDALTRSRHDSNRELIGQGIGNLVCGIVGGIPGAGTSGATLVNLSSGGKTRVSGVLTGLFALIAFVLFGPLVAWVPYSALAGILVVVAFRMIDRKTFRLLRRRTTILDFVVVAAVVLTAVALNLIAAAGVGVALAILLFLREQIRGSVVRRKSMGNQMFSKKRRPPSEMTLLEEHGTRTVIFELQGALFFGTTDQLFTELEGYIARTANYRTIVLDLKRVQSVDFTAAHMLQQIQSQISEAGSTLILTGLSESLPEYLEQVGLIRGKTAIEVFHNLGDALEAIEDRVLAENRPTAADAVLDFGEFELVRDLPAMLSRAEDGEQALQALSASVRERSLKPGERAFAQGESGDEIFLVRRGTMRIQLPIAGGKNHHLATFARGDFFGDLAFLDRGVRSADAIAPEGAELYVLSRAAFNEVARAFPELGTILFSRLARTIAFRLRQADTELRALQES